MNSTDIITGVFPDRPWLWNIRVSTPQAGVIELREGEEGEKTILVPPESVPDLVLALLKHGGYVDDDADDIDVTDLTVLANAVLTDRLVRYTRMLHHIGIFLDSQYFNLGKKTIPLYNRMQDEWAKMTKADREWNDAVLGPNGEKAA
jgi:hypothetical protein